jgi:flavodoxin
MKPLVLYASKSGNTQKIADAIASELNCKANRIDEKTGSSGIDLNDADLVFVGTGIYAGTPNADMDRYT